MEQHNKTEQDFREKLNQREITPSNQAWDRLDAMLAIAEEKKSERGYGSLYIAAAVVGFLLIGTVFFSQTEDVIDKGRNEVVFENQKNPSRSQEEITPNAVESDNVASTQNLRDVIANPGNNRQGAGQLAQQQSSNQNQLIPIITRAEGEQAGGNQNHVEAVAQTPDNQRLIASTNSIIHQNAVEQAANHPKSNQSVSVKVDELLAAAQSASANPKTSVKVNAKNLLSEVDQDVNHSFRGKMLRRAGEVADAVVNRNNE